MLVKADVGNQESQVEHVDALGVHEGAHPEKGENRDDQAGNEGRSESSVVLHEKQKVRQNVDSVQNDRRDVDDQVGGANGREVVGVEHENPCQIRIIGTWVTDCGEKTGNFNDFKFGFRENNRNSFGFSIHCQDISDVRIEQNVDRVEQQQVN